MLAGGKAWLGGLKGRGLPVSHQVGHVSAVAAEDFYFLFFCWDAQGTKLACVGERRAVLPGCAKLEVWGVRSGIFLDFGQPGGAPVQRGGKIKEVKLISG